MRPLTQSHLAWNAENQSMGSGDRSCPWSCRGGQPRKPSMTRAILLLLLATGTAQAAEWPTLPDNRITKGVTVQGTTVQKICSTKWVTDSRHVSETMKQAVIDEYHLDRRACPL